MTCRIAASPSFQTTLEQFQKEADSNLNTPNREKVSLLANRFFSYLQDKVNSVNGTNPDLNNLIECLRPFKSPHIQIESVLIKIHQALLNQNRRLMDASSQQLVYSPTSSQSIEDFRRISQLLREKNDNLSLVQILDICGFSLAQDMKDQAIRLFSFHAMKYFLEDQKNFVQQLLNYEQDALSKFSPDIVQNNITFLKKCVRHKLFETPLRRLLLKVPLELFDWLTLEGAGEKELFLGYKQYVQKKFTEAFTHFENAAKFGHKQALVEMGLCYWQEKGVEQSYEEAAELLRQAALLESARACSLLGICYFKGNGVKQSYERAVQYYRQAIDLGSARALVLLAVCYSAGKGVEQSDEKAAQLFNQAADLGNVRALVLLGKCYFTGKGVEQNYKTAIEYYQQAALLHDSYAFNEMGDCYSQGKGVKQNDKLAYECWLQAKKLKNDAGAMKVAKCLTLSNQEDQKQAKSILLDLIFKDFPGAQEFYASNFSSLANL